MAGELAIPSRMIGRPRDRRGYPIPFSQWIAEDGTPDFRILDQAQVGLCLRHRLCSLCGQKMGRHVYFIGGPSCAIHGTFYDPPMHQDCAIFAITTCPHLARSKGRYSDPTMVPSVPGYAFKAREMTAEKADTFALMHGHHYTAEFHPREGYTVTARRPWLDVKWYRDAAEVEAPKL